MSLMKRMGKEAAPGFSHRSSFILNRTVENYSIEGKLHNYLVELMKGLKEEDHDYSAMIEQHAEAFFREETPLLTFEEKHGILERVKYELIGFGPITPLLSDYTITEVMVNGPTDVYIERKGKIEKTGNLFTDGANRKVKACH